MKRKILIAFLIICLSNGLKAQNFSSSVKPSLIGFHYALVDYNSPTAIDTTSLKQVFKKGDIFNPAKQSSALTISFWKGLNKYIDFSGKFNGIFYNYALNNSGESLNNEFGAELEGALNFRPITDDHLFSPFLTAGIGGGYYTNKYGGYVPLGLGFQFNIQSQVYFLLQTQYRISLTKSVFPNNLYHSLGVAVNVGGEKKEVAVVPPPPPVQVVKDRDGDGVVDSLDACPDQPGTAALQGCPDKDGDGIADKDDKCPDVPGLAKYGGCPIPDTDKDGINDEEDKCPDVPGVAKYQGCPIPDTDKDGVNDEEDKCPNEPGPASNYGCPVIQQAVVEKVNKAAKNIYFATGSSKLLAKSFPSLKEVVQILKDNPTYKINIDGYTDNTGTPEKNQVLSENRANSVKDYLVKNGVDESKITATGHGQDDPVADNKTAAGRAKNRRVEMKLRNY
ncbi:MAG TPA: OmpA family protein [Chitinophagaceae bacterium]|nr:OmpA family protein [Chitinophagaceae bacterium]